MSHLRKAVLGRNVKRSGLTSVPQNFTPIKWSEYFDFEGQVTTDEGTFHYYKRGNSGTALVCLHGGGYSGLTWALFAAEITAAVDCHVIAIDLRGHGNTNTKDDKDLSLDRLAKDVKNVISNLYSDETPIVLVGHSLGGAVAVETSFLLESTVALCVIDVVEGTALDALSSMQSILRGRPSTFKSIPHAIQWCYKGGQTHNLDAARVSMPGQIVNLKTGKLGADECDTSENIGTEELLNEPVQRSMSTPTTILEETEIGDSTKSSCSDCGKPPLPKTSRTDFLPPDHGPKYTWRIDLSKTESFWSGWFKGLSAKFLEKHLPKLLMLANIHGLDTPLTVGQMQGKFQLQVLAKSGHAIHEDQPNHVAEILGGFLVKQKIVTAKMELSPSMPGC